MDRRQHVPSATERPIVPHLLQERDRDSARATSSSSAPPSGSRLSRRFASSTRALSSARRSRSASAVAIASRNASSARTTRRRATARPPAPRADRDASPPLRAEAPPRARAGSSQPQVSPRFAARSPAAASRSPASAASLRARRSDGPSRDPAAVGLLEVMADELVLAGRLRVEPVGDALVQLRPDLGFEIDAYATSRIRTWWKRNASSRGNGERAGSDEPAPDELEQLAPDCRDVQRARELEDRSVPELAADHRRALQHGALPRRQSVEPGREQRLRARAGPRRARRRPPRRRAPRAAPRTEGLPSASAAIRRRASGASSLLAAARDTSSSASSLGKRLEQRSPPSAHARPLAPAARAARDRRCTSGAPELQWARYSTRSRNVGSAQWRSSNATSERALLGHGLEKRAAPPRTPRRSGPRYPHGRRPPRPAGPRAPRARRRREPLGDRAARVVPGGGDDLGQREVGRTLPVRDATAAARLASSADRAPRTRPRAASFRPRPRRAR